MVKTKEDIAILREGGRRHAAILRDLAAAVRPGMSTGELDDMTALLIEKYSAGDKDTSAFLGYQPEGASYPFPGNLCISVNEEVIHGIPNDEKVLAVGDVLTLDIGLCHKGLYTDAAVTIIVGGPEAGDAKAKALLDATKRALNAGVKAAKGGGRIGDIGYAIEKVAREEGFSIADDLAGHGVGYAQHEDPFVPNTGTRGKGPLLEPGMVLAIEPIFCEGTGHVVLLDDDYTYRTADKKRAAHFEHTVVITEKGAEVLV